MTVFFTSDQHIQHVLVALLRWNATHGPGQQLVREDLSETDRVVLAHWHDKMLADKWDAVVSAGDQVFVAGDISVGGKTSEQAALEWIAARPGEKHIYLGNHDSPHPSNRDSHKAQKRYLSPIMNRDGDQVLLPAPFESVQSAGRRRFSFDGKKVDVVISHFPYFADREQPPRDLQWRLRDEGAYLIHGHLHTIKRFNGREIHVGLDAWDFAPVPLEAITEYIKHREESKVML